MKSQILSSLILGVTIFACSPKVQVYEEVNGVVAVEAEHFSEQANSELRSWYIHSLTDSAQVMPDLDVNHSATASNSSYIEILPDTRVTHADKLIDGENFTGTPGLVGVISYNVYFNNPGKYYVWVRAFSAGSEDNGIHVGIDDEWPESGKRMQWCEGKHKWTWGSKQRTVEKHCGVPGQIFLNVKTAGLHKISFSMREDGFEMDKFILSKDYTEPEGEGPNELIKYISVKEVK